MIRRINIYAGPGAGKSTTAARLFADVSVAGYDVEHVQEYVKQWAIEKRPVTGFDENYIHAKQIYAEERMLRHVEVIVTDAPLLLVCHYARYYEFRGYQHLINQSMEFEQEYKSYNIFLDRSGIPYNVSKRYQTEAEALQVDRDMEEMLQSLGISYDKISTVDYSRVLAKTLEALNVSNDLERLEDIPAGPPGSPG